MKKEVDHRFLYYKKPVIGTVSFSNDQQHQPVQLKYPNNSIGIGMAVRPPKNEIRTVNNDGNTDVEGGNTPVANDAESVKAIVICSGPENDNIDIHLKKGLTVTFVILLTLNFIITCMMYSNAAVTDPSLIESSSSSTDGVTDDVVFLRVPKHRRAVEDLVFVITLFTFGIGYVACYYHSALGLSLYALIVVLNFIFGITSVPYFFYTLRYVIDSFCVYIAMVLRSKLMYAFLPAHVRIR